MHNHRHPRARGNPEKQDRNLQLQGSSETIVITAKAGIQKGKVGSPPFAERRGTRKRSDRRGMPGAEQKRLPRSRQISERQRSPRRHARTRRHRHDNALCNPRNGFRQRSSRPHGHVRRRTTNRNKHPQPHLHQPHRRPHTAVFGSDTLTPLRTAKGDAGAKRPQGDARTQATIACPVIPVNHRHSGESRNPEGQGSRVPPAVRGSVRTTNALTPP